MINIFNRNCVFCHLDDNKIILQNDGAKAFFDIHPMAKGHLLVVPKQHFVTWFDIHQDIQIQMIELLNQAKTKLDQEFHPQGYQIFSHVGRVAGQRIGHAHIHLVPVY
ncbi:HIT family protein [Limosilactobacillus sp.]|uniref:HIT family protein n=1 Tax=Limosilactobacillus sp. TaxID=2773925 RepID=UPI00345E79D7